MSCKLEDGVQAKGGGFGVLNLRTQNIALMIKSLHKFVNQQTSFGLTWYGKPIILMVMYLTTVTTWDLFGGGTDSALWICLENSPHVEWEQVSPYFYGKISGTLTSWWENILNYIRLLWMRIFMSARLLRYRIYMICFSYHSLSLPIINCINSQINWSKSGTLVIGTPGTFPGEMHIPPKRYTIHWLALLLHHLHLNGSGNAIHCPNISFSAGCCYMTEIIFVIC